jgi:hypothetical protein
VPDPDKPMLAWNTKRGGGTSASIIADRYYELYASYDTSYPHAFGNAHIGAVGPAAFCDGSVRNLKTTYLPVAVLGIDDGQIVSASF